MEEYLFIPLTLARPKVDYEQIMNVSDAIQGIFEYD